MQQALENPRRDTNRIVLPPASYLHEKEKIEQRWPAAVKFIRERQLNEFFDGDVDEIGIIMQGGMYNGVIRALQGLGLADVWGNTRIPLYVLNVTYPLVDDEIVGFCQAKRAVLMVEEGQPEFIEQALHTILRTGRICRPRSYGKDVLPMAGEYTAAVMAAGVRKFLDREPSPEVLPDEIRAPNRSGRSLAHEQDQGAGRGGAGAPARLLHRLPGAADLRGDEAGRSANSGTHHVAADIGCHLFSILPPFNIGATTMGYGLGPASAVRLQRARRTSARSRSWATAASGTTA